MNTKPILIILLTFFTISLRAQNDPLMYLDKVMQKLETGDCDAAQKFYNVYKELTGTAMSSVETMLEDCRGFLHLGDKIDVNGEQYIIAYLMENKQHGFAIKEVGIYSLANPLTLSYLSDKKLPSLDEMRLIYKNNGSIGLTGSYWTRSVYHQDGVNYAYFYLLDFISGKEYYSRQDNKNGVLLIHRF